MTKISFSFDYELDQLSLKAHKLDITLSRSNGAVCTVDVNGYEFDALDDTLHGLSAKIGDEYVTLYEIIIAADCQYDDILAETEKEIRIESRMSAELSSPYATGRI